MKKKRNSKTEIISKLKLFSDIIRDKQEIPLSENCPAPAGYISGVKNPIEKTSYEGFSILGTTEWEWR